MDDTTSRLVTERAVRTTDLDPACRREGQSGAGGIRAVPLDSVVAGGEGGAEQDAIAVGRGREVRELAADRDLAICQDRELTSHVGVTDVDVSVAAAVHAVGARVCQGQRRVRAPRAELTGRLDKRAECAGPRWREGLLRRAFAWWREYVAAATHVLDVVVAQ